MTYLKGALTGAIVGVIVSPFLGSLAEFLLLVTSWYVLGFIQQWPGEDLAQIIPLAIISVAIVAPAVLFVGVAVGTIVGAFKGIFGSTINIGSFGGLVGSVIGLFVIPILFGGSSEIGAVVISIVVLAITGIGVALVVKQVQNRLQNR